MEKEVALVDAKRNFWVGLFVLVGLVAMGTLVVLFGRQQWIPQGANAYTLKVRFDSATGVKAGTLATISGITVGRVFDVQFVDPASFAGGVDVHILFNSGVTLRAGSSASTYEPGLGMGRPPIVISPGPADGAVLASGELIPGRMVAVVESLIPPAIVSTFDRTATQIGNAAEALAPVLKDLHEVLQPRSREEVDRPGGPPGNLASSMQRLDDSLRHVNSIIGDEASQANLKQAVANFSKMSEDGAALAADLRLAATDAREVTQSAKTLVEETRKAIGSTNENIDRVARKTLEDLELVAQTVTEFNKILTGINRGEGTLGKLATDARLYDALVLTFRKLGDTVEEFRLLVKDWQAGKIRVGL